MASSFTRSFRRASGPRRVEPGENSPLISRQIDGGGEGGHYETCLTPDAATDGHPAPSADVVYSQVHRPTPATPASKPADDDRRSSWGSHGEAHHYDNRAPIPTPRQPQTLRRNKCGTLRACHSAGLTQAEFMERSRYVPHASNLRGDPGAYDEDLYAPLPAPRKENNEEDIYESVQQHERILANIRMQPWPLAERKQYRRIMRASLEGQVGQLDTFDAVNHNGHKAVSYASNKISSYATSPSFLSSWIKKIEGHFGTGVASFFVFLRSIFFLNILTTLFSIGFIVVPQVAFGVGNTNFTNDNSGDTLDKLYNSPVFYGYYDNDTELNGHYNMPIAYLTVNLALFFICFLSITCVMRRRYRVSKRTSFDSTTCAFSLKAFTFWDFGITESRTAMLTAASIGTGFREELREVKEASRRTNFSLGLLIVIRLLINIVVVTLLAGSGYVVYYFVKRDQERTSFNANQFLAWVEQFELPFILAALKLVGPVLFENLVRLEKFHPRTAFKWTMSRTMVLYLGNLAVLTISLLMKASRQEGCSNAGGALPTLLPPTSSPPGVTEKPRDTCCWESLVGEELLKIVIIDFGAILLAVVVADVLREVVTQRSAVLCQKVGRGEFKVAVSVLDMVYGQGLVWIGTFFSPILPAFAVVKAFLLFFFYYGTTLFSHTAPRKIFRASRSGNFLLFVLQLTLFLCMLPLLYIFSRLPPSGNCGPFRSYESAYGVITSRFSQTTRDGINLVGTPVVLLPLLILCCGATLYYRLLMSSYREIIKDIRTQLHFKLICDGDPDSREGSANWRKGVHRSGGDENTSRCSIASGQSQQTQTTTVRGACASRPASMVSETNTGATPSSSRKPGGIAAEPLPEPPV